ncbi:MAG: hypothetical protein ACJ8MH_10925 [Povalibacter sp.]
MNAVAQPIASDHPWPVRAILTGGLLAGLGDILFAMYMWSWHVPRVVAAGVLGPDAMKSEAWDVWSLGLMLHFAITCAAAAIYTLTGRKLGFLKEHAFLCGLFFGIAVWLVMNLIVVPLSALHRTGPFTYESMVQGLLAHMFLVGLPIAFSAKYLSK